MSATVFANMDRKPEIDYEEGVGRAVRSLRTAGGSVVVSLPPQLLEMVQLEEGDDVELTADVEEGKITLQEYKEGDG